MTQAGYRNFRGRGNERYFSKFNMNGSWFRIIEEMDIYGISYHEFQFFLRVALRKNTFRQTFRTITSV